MKTYALDEVQELVENMDDEELETLGSIFAKLDRLALDESGRPRWSSDEMDLIGRFQDLSVVESDDDEDDESDNDEDESEEAGDESSTESGQPAAV